MSDANDRQPALPRSNITGLILAGGAGQRLGGRDKGLYPLLGRPLVTHVSERLAPQIARERFVVAESGINTPADVMRLAAVGVSAILVGESLMRQPDMNAATRALLARAPRKAAAE